MFIVSLAIADLTVGLIVMPISAIYVLTVDWPFGVGLCQFWISVDYTASTASILNLFVLSLDRYWSVTNPLRYIRKRTRGRGLVMITMVRFLLYSMKLGFMQCCSCHATQVDGVLPGRSNRQQSPAGPVNMRRNMRRCRL